MKISSGAEANIYLEKNIIKDRIKKNYRIESLDKKLRKSRTKREVKVLNKLREINFNSPKVINSTEFTIEMENINGNKVKDILEKDPLTISKKIGEQLTILHDNNIVHGDLTTSNMIKKADDIYFIDFGLSQFSIKVEDKAVDLHLFRQALESKHDKIWEECYKEFLKNYNPKSKKEIINRLEKIEARGRNKAKWMNQTLHRDKK